MIWKIPEMISCLSEYFELAAGGDTMEATVNGLPALSVKVV
ncbi:fumarylacetoacetate hydrolase family protein [Roseibium album]|nr:fumarylacetoacetate hydrolase family protein [Roseibium album]